jgi:putative glycosyltransferase (TIGR04372 family)
LFALAIYLVSVPLTVGLAILLAVRRIFCAPYQVLVLAVDNEFAGVVDMLELARTDYEQEIRYDAILVLSKFRHQTISNLYSEVLKTRILWGSGCSKLFQQALLLQPKCNLSKTYRVNSTFHLKVKKHYINRPIPIPNDLVMLRKKLFDQLALRDSEYITLSVFTLDYERERNRRFLSSVQLLESNGAELAPALDNLASLGYRTIRVGSRDTGRAAIPRAISRLEEFGVLGGPEEVVLASSCKYFWTDDVGAWWLSAPFMKPVLVTNAKFRTEPKPSRGRDIYVIRRYETLDGRPLTLREMLEYDGSPFKDAVKGALRMIRNSAEEIIEAHQEMLARLDGTWSETLAMKERRQHVDQIYHSYQDPHNYPLLLPAKFLQRHEYLLY